jgi:amidase
MHLEEATIATLQAAMNDGRLTASTLIRYYQERIQALDRSGPLLHAILELNPDALEIADALDQERKQQGARGPLHGIPVLLKDNIATTDSMQTSAGSLALLEARPPREAFIVERLRAAGAIILGKTNLSEWANFRSSHSSSGWSARGGQCRNPYLLDRTPCGSSSGSAVAIAADLAPLAIGTETDGSILCPASMNGVVGIKPTVGLTSRAGVIPIAHSQDSVGPFARTVTDAAIALSILAGRDERDPATHTIHNTTTHDYTTYLHKDGLRDVRIGIPRQVYFVYNPKADLLAEAAIELMRLQGAVIIDPADIPSASQLAHSEAEMTVLLYEFKADLNNYLSQLTNTTIRTLADLIAFNKTHKDQELPYFEQELFLQAEQTSNLDDPIYQTALTSSQRLARQEGIDAVMDQYQLDALVMPSMGPAWCIDLINGDPQMANSAQPAAQAGYPAISVPMGFVQELPVGLTFMGKAYSEPTLIKLAYAYEQHSQARRPPAYLPTFPSPAHFFIAHEGTQKEQKGEVSM